jgi:hypothetical protein
VSEDGSAVWDFLPPPPPPGEEFKWGWNAETGEATVWNVGRGGDGRPFHDDYLRDVWGRTPSRGDGDILGLALVPDTYEADGDGSLRVFVWCYYKDGTPDVVLAWFRAEFPNRIVEKARP